VEKQFQAEGGEVIGPYCPKFQPIELAWGIGKQRTGTLHKPGRKGRCGGTYGAAGTGMEARGSSA